MDGAIGARLLEGRQHGRPASAAKRLHEGVVGSRVGRCGEIDVEGDVVDSCRIEPLQQLGVKPARPRPRRRSARSRAHRWQQRRHRRSPRATARQSADRKDRCATWLASWSAARSPEIAATRMSWSIVSHLVAPSLTANSARRGFSLLLEPAVMVAVVAVTAAVTVPPPGDAADNTADARTDTANHVPPTATNDPPYDRHRRHHPRPPTPPTARQHASNNTGDWRRRRTPAPADPLLPPLPLALLPLPAATAASVADADRTGAARSRVRRSPDSRVFAIARPASAPSHLCRRCARGRV